MAERQGSNRMTVGPGQPLIGIPFDDNGQTVVHYFADEAEADAATSQRSLEDALVLAGAWADLDWEEAQVELERIRRGSSPTPPITRL